MAKKKSLLNKGEKSSGPGADLAVENGEGGPTHPRGSLSMRQLIAKKLAAEKLLTAKRSS